MSLALHHLSPMRYRPVTFFVTQKSMHAEISTKTKMVTFDLVKRPRNRYLVRRAYPNTERALKMTWNKQATGCSALMRF